SPLSGGTMWSDGQKSWPSLGSSTGQEWAFPLSAYGQFPMAANTVWPGEDPAPPVEDVIIADRGEDFVEFVFEQVEARREAEEAFFRALDERTGEIS
ncbi:hypothetical protein BSP239C_01980, partial [Brevibacterium sp. 239c]